MTPLSSEQAFFAMVRFLEQYYARGKSVDIGNLLSDLAILPDGKTADPAQLDDWKNCVDDVIKGYTAPRFKPTE